MHHDDATLKQNDISHVPICIKEEIALQFICMDDWRGFHVRTPVGITMDWKPDELSQNERGFWAGATITQKSVKKYSDWLGRHIHIIAEEKTWGTKAAFRRRLIVEWHLSDHRSLAFVHLLSLPRNSRWAFTILLLHHLKTNPEGQQMRALPRFKISFIPHRTIAISPIGVSKTMNAQSRRQ